MNHYRTTLSPRRRPDRIGGPLAAPVALVALSLSAVALLSIARSNEKSDDDARITRNEQVITSTSRILDGVVSLKQGVHARTSMEIDNGSVGINGASPDNIKFTVGEGNYDGKLVVTTRPALLTDNKGDQWIAFDEPGTENKKLEDKANHLAYVSVGEIVLQSPDSVEVDPYKDGAAKAGTLPVDYVDAGNGLGGFENSANDMGVAYALSATAPEDTGK